MLVSMVSQQQALVGKHENSPSPTVNPNLLSATIRSGCEAAIAAEPNLTKWDLIMGDGDCGEAVKGVSEGKARCVLMKSKN